jgi:hypothetical protein
MASTARKKALLKRKPDISIESYLGKDIKSPELQRTNPFA